MDNNLYMILLLLLFLVFFQDTRKKKIMTKHIIGRKNKEEKLRMREFASQFIGKQCYIYTINDTFQCVIKEVSDNAILLETKNSTDVVNLEFVLRISEINKQKNQK